MRNVKAQDSKWVARAKGNLTKLFEGEELESMPFEFQPFSNIKSKIEENITSLNAGTLGVDAYKKNCYDYELALEGQLNLYNRDISSEFYHDSIFSLRPLSGVQGWFVEFFGGENEWFDNRPPFPHPMIFDINQIDSLKPDMSKGNLFKHGLAQMNYFSKEVGESIPVCTLDLQSPIDFCSMLIDYTNLIYMMIDHPKKIHQLMRMITDTLIESMHMMKKEIIADWPVSQFPWWIPRGVFMSDDLMAILDAPLYEEFGKPYNEMISEEFGGLALHSCGNIKHNLENVATTKGIIALNTHETLETLAPVIKDRAVVITGGVKEVMAPNYPLNKRDELKTGKEVADFWWEDFNHLSEIKGQRCLYQCQALLYDHTPQETYDKMLAFSRELVKKG